MVQQQEAIVKTVALTKVFRDFWLREKVTAVKDLDLTVERGEVLGLLGPNGSGKSTTLKMILGLMFPSRGRVTVLGKSPTDVATKSRIGFLPEESYLYPFLDAYETLDYYGRLFRQPRHERKRRIEMLLDMVGLAGAAFRRVGEYSKGMQRRIGMAQALINDPDLLILDEPTSGMDPLAARQFKDLIQELSRRGKTIILSSHLLSDMEDVCHRVAILYAGQLRTQGTLEDLLAQRNLTQITTDHLDESTAHDLRAWLDSRGRQLIAVESPKDKLEALFLRIVRASQGARGRGAATEAVGVAEFLRAAPADAQALLAELTRSEPVQAGVPSPAPAAPAQPKREMLDTLLDERATAAPPAAPRPAAAPQEPSAAAKQRLAQADRSVLDSLLADEPGEKRRDA